MSRPEQEAKAGTGNEGNGERQFSMPRTPGSLIQHSPHFLHSLHSRQTSDAREPWPQSVPPRVEERCVGTECARTCMSRRSPYHIKKETMTTIRILFNSHTISHTI